MTRPTEAFGTEVPFIYFQGYEQVPRKNNPKPGKKPYPSHYFTGSKNWTADDCRNRCKKTKGDYASFYLRFSDVIVIDWDDPQTPPKEVWDWIRENKVPYTRSLSGKGFHFYMKPTDKPALKNYVGTSETEVSSLYKIDCLMFQNQTWENNKEMVCAFHETLPTITNEEIIDRFGIIQQSKREEDEKNKNDETNTEENDETTHEEFEYKDIVDMVDALSLKRLTNYSEWLNLGIVLFNIQQKDNQNNYLELWDAVSLKAENYEEGACERKWRTFSYDDNRLTLGSLIYWVSQDKPEFFKERNEILNLVYELIDITTNGDVARYFTKIYPEYINSIKFNGINTFYTCNHYNIWEENLTIPYIFYQWFSDLTNKIRSLKNQRKELMKVKEVIDNKPFYRECKEFINKCKIALKTIGNQTFKEQTARAYGMEFVRDVDFYKKLDQKKDWIAFNNLKLNLKNNTYDDIYPEDYFSISTGYDLLPENKNDTEEVFNIVNSIFRTPEMTKYVLRCVGESLEGNNKQEKAIIQQGSGRNGKGLLSRFIQASLGDYYKTIPIEYFTNPNKNPKQASPELARLRGARLVMTTEPENDASFQKSAFKSLTGGDEISARSLHKEPIQFIPQFTLWIQTNEDLKFAGGIDVALQKRLKVLKHPFTFTDNIIDPENERLIDTGLKTRIDENIDRYRTAFMHLILKCKIENTEEPETIQETLNDIILENNPVLQWFNNQDVCGYEITRNSRDGIDRKELYDAYIADTNDRMTKQGFTKKLECMSLYETKTNGIRKIKGIRVKTL